MASWWRTTRGSRKTILCIAALMAFLSGCAHSIHRVDGIDDDEAKVIWVDAKQRALFTGKRAIKTERITQSGTPPTTTKEEFVTTYRAYCTEPSPDVFSALSQAMSASGSFGQDKKSISAALQAAFSSVESGSTIPRTQTISMLRELMYRTCERYISGALNELQFPIQAVRDQHLMVSILAIEQLTGVVTPRTVALTGSANSSAGQNSSEAIVRLDDAWKNLQKSDAALKAAKADYQTLEDAEPKCSALKEKVDLGNSDIESAEQKKLSECTAQQSKATAAEANRKQAAEHYDALKTASINGGPASSTATGNVTIGADSSTPDAESIQAIAGTVKAIVGMNFEQDEFVLFCIRAMDGGIDPNLAKKCMEYIQAKVENTKEKIQLDTENVKLNAEKMREERDFIAKKNRTAFEKFWMQVASADDPDLVDVRKLQDRINAFIAKEDPPPGQLQRLNKIKTLVKKTEIERVFGMLDSEVQETLR